MKHRENMSEEKPEVEKITIKGEKELTILMAA